MKQEAAISIRDVVKQYKVRHEKGRTLKEAFLRQGIYSETINALNHVSFEVPPGSTMGLIGSNGSGKSTILKLIAGTSKPSSGEVEVCGRVSALLELGAGFHPDFTGRENVYLDGIIMGLSRSDIEERFNDIVAFAEMEEFIDAPAKTYSSGMFMRLAFSVAISVDPDILLIDEVLAVGDESFQRKCLKRINEFKAQGKTLLFVSHSMDAVRDLCDEAVWLDRGQVRATGDTQEVIGDYLRFVSEQDAKRLSKQRKTAAGREGASYRQAEITDVRLLDEDGNEKTSFEPGSYLKVQVIYKSQTRIKSPVMGIMLRKSEGSICYAVNTEVLGEVPDYLPAAGEIEFEIEKLDVLPGSYNFMVSLCNQPRTETYDERENIDFEVKGKIENEAGIMRLPSRWLNWPANG